MAHLIIRGGSVALLIACSLGAVIGASAQTPRLRREVADERWAEQGQVAVRPTSEAGNHLGAIGQEGDRLDSPASDGVAWLQANQNPSGSWGSTYEFVDTCTVIETLAATEPRCGDLADEAAWLSAQAAGNYEYLARQIAALAGVPAYEAMTASLVDDLLAVRNPAEWDPSLPNWPEGGWGVAEGYETDCLTTALAMLALDATGFNGGFAVTDEPLAAGATNIHEWEIPADAVKVRIDITVAGSTVRLRMAEGAPPTSGPYFELPPGTWLIVFPDSGLPFTPGHNFITVESTGAAATYTMTASYETPTFDTRTLAEPLDYLREAQNVDGGWGLQRGRDTEFYTTLHVLLALLKYSDYDFEGELADGIAYVQSQQLGDGSFGYDGTPISYVTALAARTLVLSETYPFSVPTEDAIAALLAMQDVDGSWDQESYHTALAVLALWEHNQPPTVDAGPDQEVTDTDEDCFEDITLSGSASDTDGTIVSYVWTEDCVEIATGPSPTVTLDIGTHGIELTVTDDGGRWASDTLSVVVNPPAEFEDCNSNAFPDQCELIGNDCNSNGTPDDCEPDCNYNGIADECDLSQGTSQDCNTNAIPDECELGQDCNTNGVPDECDITAGTSMDCNSNGVPDECEPDEDCNTNGVQDICDIAAGTSEDINLNSIPDECEACVAPPGSGDAEPDGDVDLVDYSVFEFCLAGPGIFIGAGCEAMDADGDCDVDLDDFALFQRMFTGLGGACCLPDGSCLDVPDEAACVDSNGVFQGIGTDCLSVQCPQPEACCYPDGSCEDQLPDDCVNSSGVPQGVGTDCSSVQCPQPTEACCLSDGSCTDTDPADCIASNGTPQGAGTTCATISCPFGQYSNEIDPIASYLSQGTALALGDDMTLAGTGARELVFYDLAVWGGGGGSFDVTASLYTDCPGDGGTPISGTTFTWNGLSDGPVHILQANPASVTIPDTVWMVVTFSTPESGWIIAEEAETGFTADRFGIDQPPWGCNFVFGGPDPPYAGLWANLQCVTGSSRYRPYDPLGPTANSIDAGTRVLAPPLNVR